MVFDPIKLAKKTEEVVCKGDKKRYYRFRPALFYGGVTTADCVGCCLRCLFCWSWNVVTKPNKIGEFYSAQDVADRLISLAETKGFNQLRISGGEPTIGKEHLLAVLDSIPTEYTFILETNGILIDDEYASALSKNKNLHVRVCIKADNPSIFSKITGAEKEFWHRQLDALRNLINNKVSCHPAIVVDFCKNKDMSILKEELIKIDRSLAENLELEQLRLYPVIRKRLKGTNIV